MNAYNPTDVTELKASSQADSGFKNTRSVDYQLLLHLSTNAFVPRTFQLQMAFPTSYEIIASSLEAVNITNNEQVTLR